MITKNTLGLLFLGLIALISINAVVEQPTEVKPIYYSSFGADIHGEILKGVTKYKNVFEEEKSVLKDKNFFIIYSECESQKRLIISHLACVECPIRKMTEVSNRFMPITDDWKIPIIMASDISNAHIFSEGGIRIKPAIQGYGIELNSDNDVISANFVDYGG